MYKSLSVRGAEIDKNNHNHIIQYYKINDTLFSHDFSAICIREGTAGKINEIHHLNELLYGIFYAYKFSKQSVCTNFKLVIKNTFPAAHNQIIQTKFYKEHKKLIDESIERKKNVNSYRPY